MQFDAPRSIGIPFATSPAPATGFGNSTPPAQSELDGLDQAMRKALMSLDAHLYAITDRVNALGGSLGSEPNATDGPSPPDSCYLDIARRRVATVATLETRARLIREHLARII